MGVSSRRTRPTCSRPSSESRPAGPHSPSARMLCCLGHRAPTAHIPVPRAGCSIRRGADDLSSSTGARGQRDRRTPSRTRSRLAHVHLHSSYAILMSCDRHVRHVRSPCLATSRSRADCDTLRPVTRVTVTRDSRSKIAGVVPRPSTTALFPRCCAPRLLRVRLQSVDDRSAVSLHSAWGRVGTSPGVSRALKATHGRIPIQSSTHVQLVYGLLHEIRDNS